MTLDELRKKINEYDRQIIALINERADLGHEIARAKKKEGTPLYRPDREQDVYNRISALNTGVLTDTDLFNIYREIMSATIRLEGSLSIGFLGPEGSFTHEAALKKFGHSLDFEPVHNIEEVFDLVQKRHLHYGVLPIENSTEGMVNRTLDALLDYDLNIYAEVKLLIQHNLLVNNKASGNLSEITDIYSHNQALAQCRKWLNRNLPSARWHEMASTAEAAKFVSESKSVNIAAIGSRAAAATYHLNILESDIADYDRNLTRFVVIAEDNALPSAHDETLVSFILPDSAGALNKVLQIFAAADINITSVESRPRKSTLWTYVFFLTFNGHSSDEKIADVLNQVKKITASFRLIGSYPVDITI